jgi:hypothetical protein
MVFSKKESEEETAFEPESSPILDKISWVDRYGKGFLNETCEHLR